MKFNKKLLGYAMMAAVVVPVGFTLTTTTASAASLTYSDDTIYSSESTVTINGTSTVDYKVESENGIASWNIDAVTAGAYSGTTSGSKSSANVTTTNNTTPKTDDTVKAGVNWNGERVD